MRVDKLRRLVAGEKITPADLKEEVFPHSSYRVVSHNHNTECWEEVGKINWWALSRAHQWGHNSFKFFDDFHLLKWDEPTLAGEFGEVVKRIRGEHCVIFFAPRDEDANRLLDEFEVCRLWNEGDLNPPHPWACSAFQGTVNR